ncbi:MAG: hypothetical protein LBD12_07495, partial [Clostridiales Family XIII bacterium]|nr:hypothetical protein [Clostridiales Family XIII bacterium]
MDVTLEQIDALKKRANVSYEEARAALEGTEGDLLEALIILEREGKTKHRAAGYSTNGSVPQTFSEFGAGSGAGTGARHGGKKRGANQGAGSTDWQGQWQSDGWGGSDGSFSGNGSRHHGYAGVGEVLSQLWSAFMRLIARGNINHFEVFRHG